MLLTVSIFDCAVTCIALKIGCIKLVEHHKHVHVSNRILHEAVYTSFMLWHLFDLHSNDVVVQGFINYRVLSHWKLKYFFRVEITYIYFLKENNGTVITTD